MPRLSERDLRGVLDFVAGLYAVRTLDGFARYGNVGLGGLVPYDLNGYNEINPAARRVRYVLEPAAADVPDGQAAIARHVHEHPIVTYYRRTDRRPVVTLADFLSRRQLHDLGLYTEFLGRMRIEQMIVAALPLRPPLQAGFSLCRSGRRGFTERDRQVLELVRPHLAQAYRNAEAAERAAGSARWLEAGLADSGRGLVVLGPDGRVRLVTDQARRWLAAYWGRPAPRGDGLPPPLREWLRRPDGGAARLDRPRGPLAVERHGKRLAVRSIAQGDAILLLLEEACVEPDGAALAARGLSRREAEVLTWVARGKTNPQIGLILGLSARTVGKHLERIYAKLGVETRTAAARVALSG